MRLSEDRIKQGILHPEQFVRDAAARYFADSFSDDPAVMPLAVRAVETYGWDDVFEFFAGFANLAQTQDTLLWFIGELAKAGRPSNLRQANHCLRLSSLISQADVGLLVQHETKVVALHGLFVKHREAITERLRLLAADTDACWRELEDFCEQGKDKRYINEVNLGHANCLVEAISRDGTYADRVLSVLSQEIENYENNPMKWMEPLAARLAGQMRLEAAVPLLVAKLHEDGGDLLNEECMRAFARVGTDAAVETICEPFPTAPRHYKLYACSALENIHSDTVVSRCLNLYEPERDFDIKVNLIGAVLGSFSSDGIEPARDITLRRILELRRRLVAVATLTGTTFPELDRWTTQERQEARIRKRRREEMLGEPYRPKPKPKTPAYRNPLEPRPQATITRREKAGRNDPCPCGSSRKYKKCCMNKDR